MDKLKYNMDIVLTPALASGLHELAALKKAEIDALLPVLVYQGLQRELEEWLMEARCKESAAQAAKVRPAPINWPPPVNRERRQAQPLNWKQAIALLCAEL